jgi:hypothetical protein
MLIYVKRAGRGIRDLADEIVSLRCDMGAIRTALRPGP